MALIITKPINIIGGIEISKLYVRLFVTLNYEGNEIYVNTESYISKEAFNNGKNNVINVAGIPNSKAFKYDRKINGSDILMFAHKKIKEYITTDETTKNLLIDSSTGDYLTDELGNVLVEQVVSNPKFASENQVSIYL
jgi:hypothetical protein